MEKLVNLEAGRKIEGIKLNRASKKLVGKAINRIHFGYSEDTDLLRNNLYGLMDGYDYPDTIELAKETGNEEIVGIIVGLLNQVR